MRLRAERVRRRPPPAASPPTGNYPGRATGGDELRADIDEALKLIPGKKKLNLHANYAEKGGKAVDRDAYTVDLFRGWLDWAKAQKLGLDFNPTYFSHPKADSGFTLPAPTRACGIFWIEHGKRGREIAVEFGKALGQPPAWSTSGCPTATRTCRRIPPRPGSGCWNRWTRSIASGRMDPALEEARWSQSSLA